ncbi:hypothetical protein K440DRAFT_662171 [Wilcoxina mikolae CBS 423.85]|nr:hypothetical protein K440DRAFT_662171 [Wilcoxina mikolae CBS 423.85]
MTGNVRLFLAIISPVLVSLFASQARTLARRNTSVGEITSALQSDLKITPPPTTTTITAITSLPPEPIVNLPQHQLSPLPVTTSSINAISICRTGTAFSVCGGNNSEESYVAPKPFQCFPDAVELPTSPSSTLASSPSTPSAHAPSAKETGPGSCARTTASEARGDEEYKRRFFRACLSRGICVGC